MLAGKPSFWIPALLAAALMTGSAADAQDNAAWAYQLPHELMSPFCPGRTLAQCPSPQADQLRQWILMQEAAGATRAEVEANLVERYGASILSAPKAEGWGLSAYVLPAVFFVVGGGLVFVFLQRLVRDSPTRVTAPNAPPVQRAAGIDEAELARMVDEELGLVR